MILGLPAYDGLREDERLTAIVKKLAEREE
jgi:hypothetical protein